MQTKTYQILEKCINDGVSIGYERALKYDSNPSLEWIKKIFLRQSLTKYMSILRLMAAVKLNAESWLRYLMKNF